VDANTMTRVSFGRDIVESKFASALIYKLQKKNVKSNVQSNENNAFAKGTSTSLQLLVIWECNKSKFSVRALLIKHSNIITWDEDTLEKLYIMYCVLCRDESIIEDTWLLDDATLLMTTSKWETKSCISEIIISEGTREDGAMNPLWISLDM
jgi:hypothetical protein